MSEYKSVSRLSGTYSHSEMFQKEVVHLLKATYRTGTNTTECGVEFKMGFSKDGSYKWVNGCGYLIEPVPCKKCQKLHPEWWQ